MLGMVWLIEWGFPGFSGCEIKLDRKYSKTHLRIWGFCWIFFGKIGCRRKNLEGSGSNSDQPHTLSKQDHWLGECKYTFCSSREFSSISSPINSVYGQRVMVQRRPECPTAKVPIISASFLKVPFIIHLSRKCWSLCACYYLPRIASLSGRVVWWKLVSSFFTVYIVHSFQSNHCYASYVWLDGIWGTYNFPFDGMMACGFELSVNRVQAAMVGLWCGCTFTCFGPKCSAILLSSYAGGNPSS